MDSHVSTLSAWLSEGGRRAVNAHTHNYTGTTICASQRPVTQRASPPGFWLFTFEAIERRDKRCQQHPAK